MIEQANKAKIGEAGFSRKPKMCPIEMRRNVDMAKCWANSLRDIIDKNPGVQGIFIVIPSRISDKDSEQIYANVKQIGSVQRGIFTQCVKSQQTGNRHVINGIFRQMFI